MLQKKEASSNPDITNILKTSTQYSEWLFSQDILDAKFHKRRLEVYNINLRKFFENNSNFHHV